MQSTIQARSKHSSLGTMVRGGKQVGFTHRVLCSAPTHHGPSHHVANRSRRFSPHQCPLTAIQSRHWEQAWLRDGTQAPRSKHNRKRKMMRKRISNCHNITRVTHLQDKALCLHLREGRPVNKMGHRGGWPHRVGGPINAHVGRRRDWDTYCAGKIGSTRATAICLRVLV